MSQSDLTTPDGRSTGSKLCARPKLSPWSIACKRAVGLLRAETGKAAVGFGTVLKDEDEEIERLCNSRSVRSKLPAPGTAPGVPPARFGLAFSGGGIRSAAVNLGLIQSLARCGILGQAHYISGVSGGGYILGWLTAWIARMGLTEVQKELAAPNITAAGTNEQRFLEPNPLHYLRRYVSFLIPRSGLASGDTLSAIAIYLRNVLLIQTMIACALVAAFAALQMLAPALAWGVPWGTWGVWATRIIQGLTIALGLAAWTAMGLLARNSKCTIRPYCAGAAISCGAALSIVLWTGLPIFVSHYSGIGVFLRVALWTTGLFSMSHLLANLLVSGFGEPEILNGVHSRRIWLNWVFAMAGGSSLFGLITLGLSKWLHASGNAQATVVVTETYVILGLPAILLAGSLASFLYVGLLGDAFPDAKREWLGRLSGFYLFFGVISAVVLGIAMLGPICIEWLFASPHTGWKAALVKWLLPGGWLFTTVTALFAARSPETGKNPKSPVLDLLATVGPLVFLLGFMLMASWGTHKLTTYTFGLNEYLIYGKLEPEIANAAQLSYSIASKAEKFALTLSSEEQKQWKTVHLHSDTVYPVTNGPGTDPRKRIFKFLLAMTGLGSLGAYLLAQRVSVNEFSLHLFYRNRLVRTFLGASNVFTDSTLPNYKQSARTPDPFTGFNLDDDIFLGHLRAGESKFDGPYPIWCTALNLTSGEDLAWQKRKAASFIYSPLYCGWDNYRQGVASENQAYRGVAECNASGESKNLGYGGKGGAPLIGTAMAASGAAISPNWGYHTKPAVAALLAVFNIRIGWWTGNPANDKYYKEYAPGPGYFFAELLSRARDTDRYVYLSDGGHFENLGIYELVRRRVRYIIACDADADGEYKFGDLANAVEKCRVDFGVQIRFDDYQSIAPDPEKKQNRGWSERNNAVGIIHYPDGVDGVLLYLKSSLTGNEPAQVLGQRAADPDFPHDTTLNQFYNETQFEAYRALGEFMGDEICASYRTQAGTNPEEQLVSFFESHRKLV